MPLGFEYLTAMVPEAVVPQYSVEIYFNLVIRLLLAFGIVFETPLVMWVLAAVGLVSPERFASFRKIWIVIAVVLGAVLTPPRPVHADDDGLTSDRLFELGILGARFLYKDKKAKAFLSDEAGERGPISRVLFMKASFTWSSFI